MTTPKLKLPELSVSQAGKELTHNAAIARLDQMCQATAVDKDLSTPPGSPSDGAMYIVGAAATGAWSGKENQLAFWLTSTGAWDFIAPAAGWVVYVVDEARLYQYNGSAWIIYTAGMVNPMTGVGDLVIGTTAGAPLRLAPGTASQMLAVVAGSPAWVANTQSIIIACGDETTAITSGTAKVVFRMPYAFTLTAVRASLGAAQTSGSIFTVDINEAGSSMLSTKLTIDNTEKTSTTAATAAVISDTAIADDAEISIDVDQVGSGDAAGLKVALIGYRT